jgi:hypothetical protein
MVYLKVVVKMDKTLAVQQCGGNVAKMKKTFAVQQ